MEFDVDAFIASVNKDETVQRDPKGRLNRVLMNTRTHQGTVTIIPIMSKNSKAFYTKVPRVYEFYGDTSILESGEAWYKVLPIDWYQNLTPEQIELYNEVKGYLDTLNDAEEVSYDEFRIRNYNLLYGICVSMNSTDKKESEKYKDAPCVFVYPSNSVIDALGVAINNKIDAMKGKKTWIPAVFSPSDTGRQGVLQVTFTKSAGPGYTCTVAFEFNSDMNIVVDPDTVIDPEVISKFDDVIPTFLGWMYDSTNKSYFNELAFKELRDQLKLRIKDMNARDENGNDPQPADASKNFENKNDLNKVDTGSQASSEAPTTSKKAPF